jgi:hypothetical protein
LRADFHRIPELLAQGAPEQPVTVEAVPELEEDLFDEPEAPPAEDVPEPAAQLGLF